MGEYKDQLRMLDDVTPQRFPEETLISTLSAGEHSLKKVRGVNRKLAHDLSRSEIKKSHKKLDLSSAEKNASVDQWRHRVEEQSPGRPDEEPLVPLIPGRKGVVAVGDRRGTEVIRDYEKGEVLEYAVMGPEGPREGRGRRRKNPPAWNAGWSAADETEGESGGGGGRKR